MKYMGSKNKISKHILPFIQMVLDSGDFIYIEPFVGGANIIDKIKNDKKIGCDINIFLIKMFKRLQTGWEPRKNISKEEYSNFRELSKSSEHSDDLLAEIGFIGFICSYGGRFYDGGYANKSGDRDYQAEAYRNIIKQIPNILDIDFLYCDYRELEIKNNSVVYCDIPYKNTKKYSNYRFDHESFYSWAREISRNGVHVFVSEYEMPPDFTKIWEKEVKVTLNKDKVKISSEKLFYIGNFNFQGKNEEWICDGL